MPTKSFSKCYFEAGDQRIRYNRDRAEALQIWSADEIETYCTNVNL